MAAGSLPLIRPMWSVDRWHRPGDLLGLHCLLLDPAQVWREPVVPFEEDGSPSRRLQESARQIGVTAAELPFTRDGYVVHLGRTTLRAVLHDDAREQPLLRLGPLPRRAAFHGRAGGAHAIRRVPRGVHRRGRPAHGGAAHRGLPARVSRAPPLATARAPLIRVQVNTATCSGRSGGRANPPSRL